MEKLSEFVIVDAQEIMVSLHGTEPFEQIALFWEDLGLDTYMMDGGTYRNRRFGQFKYDTGKGCLEFLEGRNSFFQPKSVNALNGDLVRTFPEIQIGFSNSAFLNRLVQIAIGLFGLGHIPLVMVNVHQIRIRCSRNMLGLPTPEGIHRDGHAFVSQHLISRKNVEGGISKIYSLEEQLLLQHRLSAPMESIFLNDKKVKHETTAIRPEKDSENGYRDMLIIDYNPVSD